MNKNMYWKECISESAKACGLKITEDQLVKIADDVMSCLEIEMDYKKRYEEIEREYAIYREINELP